VTWALVCFVCCMILLMRSSCSRVKPSPSNIAPSLSVIVGELDIRVLPMLWLLLLPMLPLLQLPTDEEEHDVDDDAVDEAFEDVDVVGDSSVTPVLMGKFMALICSSDNAIPVAASTTELPVEM